MRGLMRNKRWVTYKNYLGVTYKEDSQGRKTGRKLTTLSIAKPLFCSVSTPTGTTELEMYGKDEKYDKIIVVDKPDVVVHETSIFWIDKEYGENVAHDYYVVRMLRNHNFLTIGLRKVDVKHEQSNQNGTNS